MNKSYDSTVARIAGNIASGLVRVDYTREFIATYSVAVARLIIAEVERTEPKTDKNGYVKD